MIRDIAIVSSGHLHLPYPDIAALFFTGRTFRMALRYARNHAFDQNILVLSPRYGLLALTDRVEPYDAEWGEEGAVDKQFVARQIERNYPERLRFLMLCATPQVTLLLDAYRGVKRQHALFEAPLMELGQDYHRNWLRKNSESECDLMNDPRNVKADGGSRIKLNHNAKNLEEAHLIADQWRELHAGKLLYPPEPTQNKNGDWMVSAVVLLGE